MCGKNIAIASDGTVYVSLTNKNVYTSKVFRSATGNSGSFEDLSTGKSGKLPYSGILRTECAVAPSDPNIVYASCVSGQIIGIYMSKDKGDTWEVIGPGGSDAFNPFMAQGYYNNSLFVFPDNPKRLWVGGVDIYEWQEGKTWQQISSGGFPTTYKKYVHSDIHTFVLHPNNKTIYIGTDGGIFSTDDFGISFKALNKNLAITQFYTVNFSTNGSVIGGTQDNGSIFIGSKFADPSWNLNTSKDGWRFRGGDGGYSHISTIDPKTWISGVYFAGISRTPDEGTTWAEYKDFLGPRIIALGKGKGPDGSDAEPGNAIKTGFPASFVTPTALWESFNDTNTTDFVYYIADEPITKGQQIKAFSRNKAYPIYSNATKNLNKGDTLIIKDIIQARFYLGLNGSVWMTKDVLKFDKTPEWFRIANIDGMAQTLAYTHDGNTLFVGTTSGNLYRISNLLNAHDSITADVASDKCVLSIKKLTTPWAYRFITSLYTDPHNPNRLLITLGNFGNSQYIYYTENALDDNPTFENKQGDLPAMPIYTAIFEYSNPNNVLIGTDYGVYSTTDITQPTPQWQPDNNGLPKTQIYMLKQQINTRANVVGTIYAATHGRGIFKCTKYEFTPVKENTILNNSNYEINIFPNPVKNYTTISFTANSVDNTSINIYNLKGQKVKELNVMTTSSGINNFNLDMSNFEKGIYLINVNNKYINKSIRCIKL